MTASELNLSNLDLNCGRIQFVNYTNLIGI